ncbi:MAG: sensor histidine kinase [Actinomycetes bacterium]
MSTLGDLAGSRTDLGPDDLDWLHRLVAEWQLIADLSFADLVLRVRTREGSWLAVAHMRPTTGPTVHPDDLVGSEATGADVARVERAWSTGAIVRDGERGRSKVRMEAVPVRRGESVVAVVTRETDPAASRIPSQLELTYLTTAGELLQMVAEGSFPFPGAPDDGRPDPEHAPRVGDGLLRLDRTGHVVYASPNAISAFRRLGVTADLLGVHLGTTIARLTAAPGVLDEPRGSAALAAALRFREPRESEVEAQGATVLLRALPLATAGQPRGVLVLVRDVTELRRRERQILGKDATIREIHHRVKNNLQTVAALLRMQARRLDSAEARAALEESVRRVAAIAVVHERLSQAADESVPFDGVADQVLAMCAEVAAPESTVRVRRTGSPGRLPADVATALAMVLTELVQNAVEHGFAGTEQGCVDVAFDRSDDALTVSVTDDGRGLPAGFSLDGSARLGLQIVRTLVEGELRGVLQVEPTGSGTRARVALPLGPPGDGGLGR